MKIHKQTYVQNFILAEHNEDVTIFFVSSFTDKEVFLLVRTEIFQSHGQQSDTKIFLLYDGAKKNARVHSRARNRGRGGPAAPEKIWTDPTNFPE